MLPSSARVIPDKKHQQVVPTSIADIWRLGAFIAYKGRVHDRRRGAMSSLAEPVFVQGVRTLGAIVKLRCGVVA